MFYEMMWRIQGQERQMPLPWWVQQYFRRWIDAYDGGLFASKEAAFASNAHYRYWNMVGVKDHRQESLIGQAGEIEPVYDQYAVSFFLYDPDAGKLHFPQSSQGGASSVEQSMEDGYLPICTTRYDSPMGVDVTQKVIATTVGADQKSLVLARTQVRLRGPTPARAWLCIAVSPAGPTGFQRHDNAGRYLADRRLTYLRYDPAQQWLQVNSSWGPVFDRAPAHWGTYGNGDSYDPTQYLDHSPFQDLLDNGTLNGQNEATDHIAGLCSGVFAWPVELSQAEPVFRLEIRLPVDDFRGPGDLAELRAADADALEANNRTFWINKLDHSGLQASLPPRAQPFYDLYRTCRANLLILSDDGQIHPGPTIYDSFWVRDSSVEGIACALAGDRTLAERQFGHHYPGVFNTEQGTLGPASLYGFYGGEHEKRDREWDSNGQALWAIGRLDRILGPSSGFGAGLYTPYVLDGARWIRDNRSQYGLLHSGWSAEHIGDKHQPHYWDDLWGLAGLWEAAKLAERIGAHEVDEIWRAYDSLRRATIDSIRWVLSEQRRRGFWETFIPTGPGDVGRLDSTMIGILAYYTCRLYVGQKLGAEVDAAARHTLETIWHHFVVGGGFRHDAAWHAYGPYLTLQLAHAFLLLGEVARMESLLTWTVGAGQAQVSRGEPDEGRWQVVLGAWNEQHAYPVASDFQEVPGRSWYMGDIPHGWACAEYMSLLRDMLFFEVDEDGDPHIYLAPGVLRGWLQDGEPLVVADAPTSLGVPFGYRLTHHAAERSIEIEITQPAPPGVVYVYPCRLGSGVEAVVANGQSLPVAGTDVWLPAGTTRATITYL